MWTYPRERGRPWRSPVQVIPGAGSRRRDHIAGSVPTGRAHARITCHPGRSIRCAPASWPRIHRRSQGNRIFPDAWCDGNTAGGQSGPAPQEAPQAHAHRPAVLRSLRRSARPAPRPHHTPCAARHRHHCDLCRHRRRRHLGRCRALRTRQGVVVPHLSGSAPRHPLPRHLRPDRARRRSGRLQDGLPRLGPNAGRCDRRRGGGDRWWVRPPTYTPARAAAPSSMRN